MVINCNLLIAKEVLPLFLTFPKVTDKVAVHCRTPTRLINTL